MKKIFILLCWLSSFLLTSCGIPQSIQEIIRTPAPGERLFFDDFSNPSSGWETWVNSGAGIAYEQEGLRVVINQPDYMHWSRPNSKEYKDIRLEVEARKLSGPENNAYGLMCRFKDDHYYAFLASSDGYYGILKVNQGTYRLLGSDQMKYSDMIRQGTAANALRADCAGNRLIFYVNGEELMNVEDSEFTGGQVGIIAGTYQEPGIDILFDNFIIYKY